MNFQPLFTASRVITAVYRVVSTTVLLAYLARRLKEKPKRTKTYRNVTDAIDRY